MSTKSDGGSAFPFSSIDGWSSDGMTLRDYFAAQAMTGMVMAYAVTGHKPSDDQLNVPEMAERCYELADAMLEERGK
jgi:hypothetical protein